MKQDIFKDKEALVRQIDAWFSDQSDTSRIIQERIIFRNLLYYMGEQYVEFMRSSGQFRKRNLPIYTPTPVDNEICEYVRSVKAMLMNQKMAPRVWPNTDEKEDIQAADAGQAYLVSLLNANDGQFFEEKEKTCIWLVLAGTGFMRTFPDADGGLWLPDGGKTGEVASESIIPFNVRMDTMGDTLKRKRWTGIQSLKDKEWVEDTFHVKIEHSEQSKSQVDYQKRIAKLVGAVSPWKLSSFDMQTIDSDNDDLVLFKEIEFAPQKAFPEGRYAISCGGKLLKSYDQLPIPAKDGWWDYSLTDFHWNYVPGRFWSEAGVSNLISSQNTINEILQAYAINRKGLGRPTVLCAGEIGLKKIDSGGHGVLALSYDPIMGQKPDFQQGVPLTNDVLDELRLHQEAFQNASGDPKNILRGNQPSANASGVLTDSLRETAEQGRYPDIDRFNRSLCRVHKKQLLVAQMVITEERMIKQLGRDNKIKISKFKGADIRNNSDVRLELDSGLISTKSGQAQMIVDLIKGGFFNEGDNAVPPSTRKEMMERLGMTTFTDETDSNVERAEEENLRIANGENDVMTTTQDPETGEDMIVTDDPLFRLDPHEIHHQIHRKYILSPSFRELPQEAQVVLIKHDEAHEKAIAQKPPDIREYVQYDKLIPLLTQSERAQLLAQMGITAGNEPMVGIPSADVVLKGKVKLKDTEMRETGKVPQMEHDMTKHIITEGVKASAIQAKKSEGRVQGSKPK